MDRSPRLRLVARLVGATVFAGAVTGVVGAVLVDASARRALEAEIAQRNAQTARAHSVRIDDRVDQRLEALLRNTTRSGIQTPGPGSRHELAVLLRGLDEVDELSLYDASGRPVAAVAERRLLSTADLDPRAGLDDVPDEGHVRLLPGELEAQLELIVPVKAVTGEITGWLVAVIGLDDVAAPIESSRESVGFLSYLTDRDGCVLVHPHRDLVRSRACHERVTGAEPADGQVDVGRVEVDGTERFMAVARVRSIPALVVVEQDVAAALVPARRWGRQLAVILVLVLLATVVAVSLAGRVLLGRLRPLVVAAERLGAGDEATRVEVKGDDEVAVLAREFNRMSLSLKRRMDELRTARHEEQRLQEEARVAETLYHVGTTLSSQLDVREVVRSVTDICTQLTGARCGAFVHAPDTDTGTYTTDPAGMGADGSPLLRHLRDGREVGRIIRINDLAAEPHRPAPDAEADASVRSLLVVRVPSRSGEMLGTLAFGHPEPGRFTEAHERLVAGVAAHAGVCLDNAGLYEAERVARREAEEAQRRLALLAEASKALGESLEPDDVLRTLAGLLAPGVADLCGVDLLEDDGRIRRLASVGDPALGSLLERIEGRAPDPDNRDHPIVQAMRSREPVLLPEVSAEVVGAAVADPVLREEILASRVLSAIVVPLEGRRGVFGAVSAATTALSGRRLGPDDLRFIEELARRGADAIENARLYAHERSVAETLQQSLLPDQLPQLPGITAAARYLAGGSGAEVGGDWYDMFELAGGGVAITMGDVVGRGIGAASLMGQLRNALRAYAVEGHGPGELLTLLNTVMHDWDPEHLATLYYGVFEPASGVFRSASAGHPPPVVRSGDGTVSFLDHDNGVPLGALFHNPCPEAVTTLAPGAALLLYTDGLVEDRKMALDEGFERLRQTVRAAPEGAEEFCDHVLAEMLRGRVSEDDVAILVVRSVAD